MVSQSASSGGQENTLARRRYPGRRAQIASTARKAALDAALFVAQVEAALEVLATQSVGGQRLRHAHRIVEAHRQVAAPGEFLVAADLEGTHRAVAVEPDFAVAVRGAQCGRAHAIGNEIAQCARQREVTELETRIQQAPRRHALSMD